MKTKTLDAIQVLAKIGKIFSNIVQVCCIVGCGICLVGLIGMAIGADVVKIGGVNLEDMAKVSIGSVYATMAVGLIMCAGEAVLAKFATGYFKHELAVGTPFSYDGSKELMRLGILTICIPLGTQIIAAITHAIMKHTMENVGSVDLGNGASVALGVTFIIVSVIFRYGAEIQENDQDII